MMSAAFKKTVLSSAILFTLASPAAFATNGMTSHGYGTTQKAMGGAAVAGHDNAMNMATNPASMSFGENNWTAGLEIFRPDRGAKVPSPDPITGLPTGTVQSYDGNGKQNFFIPEFGYQRKLNNKHSIGIAVYGNGGMNTQYDSGVLNFGGTNPAGIDLQQLFIAPSWSMKTSEDSAFGVSLNLVYQSIEIKGLQNFTSTVPGQIVSSDPANVTDRGKDTSTGAGITVGWQGQLTPNMKVGAAYRSRTYMSKFDKYKGLLAEQGDMDIPSMFTVGASVQATPKTTFAVDLAHIRYSEVNSIGNQQSTTALLGTTNGSGFGWEDQTILKIGFKHQVKPKLALMAGFNHGDTPIPTSQTFFNVLAPATVEDHITLGADWKLNNKSNLTVQYMHAFKNNIKGTTGGVANNIDINMKQNALGVAYTSKF